MFYLDVLFNNITLLFSVFRFLPSLNCGYFLAMQSSNKALECANRDTVTRRETVIGLKHRSETNDGMLQVFLDSV